LTKKKAKHATLPGQGAWRGKPEGLAAHSSGTKHLKEKKFSRLISQIETQAFKFSQTESLGRR
jgi:hypothetical protein